jgi:hypothetical protein
MDALLMGVLCAWIVRQPFFHSGRRAVTIPFWLLFAGTLFFAARFSGVAKPAITVGFTWLAAFYAAVLLTLVSRGWAPSKAIFSFAPLRHLGSIAYGVYLLHIPVVGIVFAVLFNEPPRISNIYEVMAASFALCCTVGMAMLSLKYFERRFQTMGRSIRYEWSPVTWRSIAVAARDRTPMIRSELAMDCGGRVEDEIKVIPPMPEAEIGRATPAGRGKFRKKGLLRRSRIDPTKYHAKRSASRCSIGNRMGPITVAALPHFQERQAWGPGSGPPFGIADPFLQRRRR